MGSQLSQHVRKGLGAYYTPDRVAAFLTSWAIRDRSDTVLDPSAGEGVFLLAARERLLELGGDVASQVAGIELSPETYQLTNIDLANLRSRPALLRGDFFDFQASAMAPVTAIVGNPPFIRYQRFTGASRKKALSRAEDAGVKLSELSSSWAPFLVHAATFIESGGRMAVVAPAELAHASYAQPVVKFLCGAFSKVKLLSFGKRLFPDISEDTVLVLAEGRGAQFHELTVHDLDGPESLAAVSHTALERTGSRATTGWTNGVTRFVEHFLPAVTRGLYSELASHPAVVRLGSVAEVGIGYVTGNNDFFHLSAQEAKDRAIPQRHLAKAIRNGRGVNGLVFSGEDWRLLREAGAKNWLVKIRSTAEAGDAPIAAYIAEGLRAGVDKAYKCRVRDPWYSVPHVHIGDAFLTYMSGTKPKLFLNGARAVAPNTLHVVRLRRGAMVTPLQLTASWNSALTGLSCEVQGHSLGGGMLKLEPRESGQVLVAALPVRQSVVDELDGLARSGRLDEVQSQVDRLMQDTLGLSHRDLVRLTEATSLLRSRRTGR